MKRFIAGFITCLILLSTIFMTGFAEDALAVFLNKFPIYINGQQVEVESYNINGRTFVSIGDVAKLIGATVVNNEVDKKIEIKFNMPKSISSTASKIEYDPITGLPIGAEYVDMGFDEKGLKYDKGIKYNDKLYVTELYLFKKHNITYKVPIVTDTIYVKDGKEVTINFKDKSQYFYVGAVTYYNIELFKELMGE